MIAAGAQVDAIAAVVFNQVALDQIAVTPLIEGETVARVAAHGVVQHLVVNRQPIVAVTGVKFGMNANAVAPIVVDQVVAHNIAGGLGQHNAIFAIAVRLVVKDLIVIRAAI